MALYQKVAIEEACLPPKPCRYNFRSGDDTSFSDFVSCDNGGYCGEGSVVLQRASSWRRRPGGPPCAELLAAVAAAGARYKLRVVAAAAAAAAAAGAAATAAASVRTGARCSRVTAPFTEEETSSAENALVAPFGVPVEAAVAYRPDRGLHQDPHEGSCEGAREAGAKPHFIPLQLPPAALNHECSVQPNAAAAADHEVTNISQTDRGRRIDQSYFALKAVIRSMAEGGALPDSPRRDHARSLLRHARKCRRRVYYPPE